LSIVVFYLLPIGTAHAQAVFDAEVTQETSTVNPQTGQVIITGTLTCSEPTEAEVYIKVTQPIGREGAVEGVNAALLYCDEDGEPYTFSIFGHNGRFGAGRAVVSMDVFACGLETCEHEVLQQSVRLSTSSH
jgi:hypothetical protein